MNAIFDKLFCWIIDRYADLYVLFNPITPVDTARINGQIHAVRTGQTNFYLYIRDGHVICIDTGFGKPVIKRELARLPLHPDAVSHVFLTHTDFDHTGGVALFPHAKIHLSRDEEAMIDGTRARMFGVIHNRLRCKQYELLCDNERRHIGAITVRAISTPGHTPGSMCYLVDDKYLFTGDAFRIIDGRVRPIRPFLTMDRAAEADSIKKLARLPHVQMVLTAHRGFSENYYEIMADVTD